MRALSPARRLALQAAIEALPDEMTYYNNLAAVFYEQKKFDECIEKCKKAVEVGRSMRADYKVVAKSFARIGNAYKVRAACARQPRRARAALRARRPADGRPVMLTSAARAVRWR